MDFMSIGKVGDYIKSYNAQKKVEIKKESGNFSTEKRDSFKRSNAENFKAQIREAVNDAENALRSAEETMRGSSDKAMDTIRNALNAQNAPKAAQNDAKKDTQSAQSAQNTQNKQNTQEAEKTDPKNGAEDAKKSIAEMVKEQMEKLDSLFGDKEYDKASDSNLSSIRTKLYMGKKLTPAEQQYLAKRDPNTYSQYQQLETQRRIYRCTLRSCRTKDQVNGMRLSNALSALSELKKAAKNGGGASGIAGLNAALNDELNEFTRSGEYNRLPTAAEVSKVNRDLAKARKYEREKRAEQREKLKARRKKKKKTKKTPGDGKRTVAQVMSTPEAKKVMRSRANSAYSAGQEMAVVSHLYKMNRKA
ncbi:MAG: hypothetical protein K2G32_08680 [Oscillospiraceae bacterium]|nr:hypothetical protein [Oscillospiraceae bacterium]